MILKLLLLLSIRFCGCAIVAPLECRVVFGHIFLDVPLTKIADKHYGDASQLVFQSINMRTKETSNLTLCRYPSKNVIRCNAWPVNTIPPSDKFNLKVLNRSNAAVIWNYDNIFQPSKDFYHCFSTHAIKNLNVIGLDSTKIEIKWETNHWDEQYNFIKYHNVSVVYNGRKEVIKSGIDCPNNYCEFTVNELSPCNNYNVCVDTLLTEEVLKKCVYVETRCNDTDNDISVIFIIIALIAMFIILVVLIVAILHRKRRGKKEKSRANIDDIIEPRNECVYEEIADDGYCPYIVVGDIIGGVDKIHMLLDNDGLHEGHGGGHTYEEIKEERYVMS